MDKIINIIAKELSISEKQVIDTVNLIDEGNTIPFIARYRKEVTGGLSDEVLRNFDERLKYLRNLEDRKTEIINLIDEQGKLNEELKLEIENADKLVTLEDLYRPYKKKRETRATKAKALGLEPLALLIMEQKTVGDINDFAKEYVTDDLSLEKVTMGAMDIICEIISDNAKYREHIRKEFETKAIITVKKACEEESVYEMYYDFTEPVNKILNHRILAINRGEKEKFLKVNLESNDDEIIEYIVNEVVINSDAMGNKELILSIEDAYKRLIRPSIEREIRTMLTERAEEDAIKVFALNTRPLLLTPPVRDVSVLAIDPSYRTGCKLAVLDKTGKLLDYKTVYPNEPRNEVEKSQKVMKDLILKYNIDIISIGNGTASRETEKVVADMLSKIDKTVYYTIVSEAGASVYSASKLATEEYPDLDVSIRGAISIGRRLQDPLSELVKIDTKHIGVGQYQHDLNQKKLDESLKNVVEDCVNSVGIDLNIATPSILSYVSGISQSVAKNIVTYRNEKGKFNSRNELLEVKRLGEKVYEQCAGFLRIHDAENILDNTSVHPESYDKTRALLQKLNYNFEDLGDKKDPFKDIEKRILDYKIETNDKKKLTSMKGLSALKSLKIEKDDKIDAKEVDKHLRKIAEELNIGFPTIKDIVSELKKPGRDIRDEMPKPIFRSDVLSLEDLEVGMELMGTVRNVVDFGAFVDIGVKQDGLVHISELSNKFVKSASAVVSVGDQVKVKVINVDIDKAKISLTMKL